MNKRIVYLVEGKCEKQLIDAIKNEYIVSGRIFVFNALLKLIPKTMILPFAPNTFIVIVFDTDVDNIEKIDRLNYNIKFLKQSSNIKGIILIPQVQNFEDEILFSCNIKQIKDFFNSKTNTEFKTDFIKHSCQISSKLKKYNFNIDKFWSRNACNNFSQFKNKSKEIKL